MKKQGISGKNGSTGVNGSENSGVRRRDFCGSMAGGLLFLAVPASRLNAEETVNADDAADGAADGENDGKNQEAHPCFSGIYPHLANWNREGECGTGAVVPWAGKLWAVSYGPHSPWGSSDKLYEIDENLNKTTRPESTGGTHANRMIHPESNQLFIGCYAINADGEVRVISYKDMPGRLTGCARNLKDPVNKIDFATMEEGIYEVDVHSLAVKQLYCDSNRKDAEYKDILPGYHGKGFYSAQNRLVYANNGEQSPEALHRPETVSGCLGQWLGKDWEIVLRNQFTEVTGPGGILGSDRSGKNRDTLWAVGWDYRSLILMILDGGQWHKYRLPKASHCYDGAHGWNTEWPRIREVGDASDLLMTMHGLFWHFPADMNSKNARGIRPRSTYLKVIGDFCRWKDRIVCGCDDTAKSEFLNKSPFKGTLSEPGQSNSNYWFLDPQLLDRLGTPLGRGAVWFDETVEADAASEPYLFAGWDFRSVHLKHDAGENVEFRFEIDRTGDGTWETFQTVSSSGDTWAEFPADAQGEWIRVTASRKIPHGTCFFQYSNRSIHTSAPDDERFAGLASPGAKNVYGGLLWVRPDNQRLAVIAERVTDGKAEEPHYYELTENSELVPGKTYEGGEPGTIGRIRQKVAVPELAENVYHADGLSVVCTYEKKEYRLPVACEEILAPQVLPMRLDREVATERDLFHCAGMFYELPAVNAGGLPKIRPIARDGRFITDYASYRGLMVFTGVDPEQGKNNPHILVSADGKAAVWAGAIDDLWAFGKPTARGFFWKNTSVKAGDASLPFLMTGFDRKTLLFTNHSGTESVIRFETDITGTGIWSLFRTFTVPAGETFRYEFPAAFQSYWFRCIPEGDSVLTGEMIYD